MTPFPDTSSEIASLKRFRDSLGAAETADDNVKTQITKADQLLVRLGGPIRVAVLGGPKSGKTSLVNFLVGDDLIPLENGKHPRPPIIIRYAETPATIAGWWSGIEIAEEGLNIDAGVVHSPDFVEFRIPNPILPFLSFMEMPRAGDSKELGEQLRWVSHRADVVIWSTTAKNPWSDEEAQIWQPYAEKLSGRSILAVTHMDKSDAGVEEIGQSVKSRAVDAFHSVVMIATTEAAKATPGGQVTNPAAWEASGGRSLAASIIALSRKIRRSEIEAVHRLTGVSENTGAATAEPSHEPHETVKTYAAETPPLDPKEITPTPPKQQAGDQEVVSEQPNTTAPDLKDIAQDLKALFAEDENASLLGLIQHRLDKLIAYADDDDNFRIWEFLNSVVEIADEISNMAAPKEALKEEAAWLRSQVDDAFGEFNLMQMGGQEEHCLKAATLFLQMARDFSWAAANAKEA